MPWLKHPSYVPVRDELIQKLKTHLWIVGRGQPVVFLCGGYRSHRREALAEFLRRHTSCLVFFAEDIWTDDADGNDALLLEKRLADLADLIVVIVESPGTFAELGAFSLDPKLNPKLLAILDRQFERDESFINLGPVRTLAKTSSYGRPIFTDFSVILTCSGELQARIGSGFSRKRFEALAPRTLHENPKSLLSLIVHLVSWLFPVNDDHIKYYIRKIAGNGLNTRVSELLMLAVSLRLIRRVTLAAAGVAGDFYVVDSIPNMVRGERLAQSKERARVVGVLQSIPSARGFFFEFLRQSKRDAA